MGTKQRNVHKRKKTILSFFSANEFFKGQLRTFTAIFDEFVIASDFMMLRRRHRQRIYILILWASSAQVGEKKKRPSPLGAWSTHFSLKSFLHLATRCIFSVQIRHLMSMNRHLMSLNLYVMKIRLCL